MKTIVAIVVMAAGAPGAAADSADAEEPATQPGLVQAELIFDEAPFEQCHASTVVETAGGLVAAWFGGSEEGRPDVGIWLSRQVDGEWTAPVEVADGVQSPEKRHPCWNPVLFQPREGPLMLFFKVGPSPSKWWGEWMISEDGGKTWRDRQRLPDEGIGPVKNKPIQLATGEILCASSTEHDGWRVHFERTADLGKSWQRTKAINDGKTIGAIQPSILTYPDGRMQVLCRDRKGDGNIWQSWSGDGGKTWSPMESTGLPNPCSGTDAVTLADGRQLLVYNHTIRSGPSPRRREMLNVAVSPDGKTWHAALVLEKGPGEYSYPAVIQTADGRVHVTYTHRRRNIKHVIIDPARLVLREIRDGKWPE